MPTERGGDTSRTTSVEPSPQIATNVRSDIVVAAARLLRNGGARAVTTRGVAHAAGVSAPAIFRLFGDKDGLMDAVAEHVVRLYSDAKAAGAVHEGSDPVHDLRVAWHAHVEFGLANPDLFVLLLTPGRLEHSTGTATGVAVLEKRVARLAAAGLLAVSPARAVSMIHAVGNGTVLALLTQPVDSRDDGLADATLDAVLGSILTRTPSPSASEPTALVNAFAAALSELPALSEGERTVLSEWLARTTSALQEGEGHGASPS